VSTRPSGSRSNTTLRAWFGISTVTFTGTGWTVTCGCTVICGSTIRLTDGGCVIPARFSRMSGSSPSLGATTWNESSCRYSASTLDTSPSSRGVNVKRH
jgi:hypothetical protein